MLTFIPDFINCEIYAQDEQPYVIDAKGNRWNLNIEDPEVFSEWQKSLKKPTYYQRFKNFMHRQLFNILKGMLKVSIYIAKKAAQLFFRNSPDKKNAILTLLDMLATLAEIKMTPALEQQAASKEAFREQLITLLTDLFPNHNSTFIKHSIFQATKNTLLMLCNYFILPREINHCDIINHNGITFMLKQNGTLRSIEELSNLSQNESLLPVMWQHRDLVSLKYIPVPKSQPFPYISTQTPSTMSSIFMLIQDKFSTASEKSFTSLAIKASLYFTAASQISSIQAKFLHSDFKSVAPTPFASCMLMQLKQHNENKQQLCSLSPITGAVISTYFTTVSQTNPIHAKFLQGAFNNFSLAPFASYCMLMQSKRHNTNKQQFCSLSPVTSAIINTYFTTTSQEKFLLGNFKHFALTPLASYCMFMQSKQHNENKQQPYSLFPITSSTISYQPTVQLARKAETNFDITKNRLFSFSYSTMALTLGYRPFLSSPINFNFNGLLGLQARTLYPPI